MKEKEEGREGGVKGGKEGRQGEGKCAFKEDAPSSTKNRWFCPTKFQPLKTLTWAWRHRDLGSQVPVHGVLAHCPAATPKAEKVPHGWGGVG